MDDWKELLNKDVYSIVLAVHIKGNKVMVRIREDVNLFTFKSNEEAMLKAERISAKLKTVSLESALDYFYESLD